jgi:uncharacterized repeat protein (TIGR01451 family)
MGPSRVPRLLGWAVLAALLGGLVAAGCGGGVASLSVKLTLSSGSSTVAPGASVGFVIVVKDIGSQGTSGLTVTAGLPADFRYTHTESLSGSGVRTSPVEAQGNSQQPTWGVWLLTPGDDVTISFDALAGGSPGSYSMTASASGATTSGSTQSNALALKLSQAPLLSASVSVSPSQAVPGQDVTYQVTVLNTGTGPADQVSITVTLPPVFIYDGGIQIRGDSGRSGGTDPVEGTVLPYFDGFEVPPQSGAAPGELILKFDAQVLSSAGAQGSYPCGVQVLGDAGVERIEIADSAPVQVT